MIGSELPKGWNKVKLLDIADLSTGKVDANHSTEDGLYPFFTCASEPMKSPDYSFDDESVIVPGNGANVGCVLYYNGKFQAYQRTYVLSNIKIVPKYLYYHFLRYWKERTENNQFGSATNYVKLINFANYIVDMPSLTEQKQIAEKLDKLFDQIETIKEASNKIPELLKNFRQQVLTYAVTGKLTDSDYESWELKTLDEIAIPKAGYAFKATDFIDNGIQVIRMGNLYDNKLSLDRNPVFVPKNYDTDIIERSRVKRNDILLTLTGTKYKRDYGYAIKIDTDEVLLLNQRILSLTPLIDPDYLLLVLRSDEFRNQFFEFETGGVNQGNVGVKNVMTIKLHIPSPRIQEEIVRRTKILFNILDNVERRYNILCEKLDKLPQALLCKAFNGKLAL